MEEIKRVSEGAVLPRDERVLTELTALRHFVDNFNVTPKIALRAGDTFKQLSEAEVFTTKLDGWEFGYKLEEYPTFFKRKVYIKCLEGRIGDVPELERKAVVTSVFEACIDIGQGLVEVDLIAPDCLLVTQEFSPIFLKEKSPRVVVPGGTGKA